MASLAPPSSSSSTSFPLPSPLPSPPLSESSPSPTTDYSTTPLSTLLRTTTILAHEQVMLPPFVSLLTRGALPLPLHTRYLLLLHAVYSALEEALENHASHPQLSGIHDPALLGRREALEGDLQYFHQGEQWSEGEEAIRLRQEGLPKGVQGYVDRLRELGQVAEAEGSEDKATLLLAHAYVRYLGDLSGGQSIARALRKSYSLPPTGEGSSFYEFFLPPTSRFSSSFNSSGGGGLPQRADLNETKKIKEWFRAGLDRAGEGLTERERKEVCEEASRAFGWNMLLFDSFTPLLPAPSSAQPQQQQLPTPSPTPIRSPSPPHKKVRKDAELPPPPRPPTLLPVLPAILLALALAIYVSWRGCEEVGGRLG